jgi:hypothetical protein
VRVFEGMEDEFTVCKVFEAEIWACHALKDGWPASASASTSRVVGPDRKRHAGRAVMICAEGHFDLRRVSWLCGVPSVVSVSQSSWIIQYLCSFILAPDAFFFYLS